MNNNVSYGNQTPPIDWWDDDVEGMRHASLDTYVRTLRTSQSSRISAGMLYDATYEGRNVFATDMASSFGSGGNLMGLDATSEMTLLTYNAMQIGFDTLVSKLTQADAAVRFMTDGGDWLNRKKAEQLEKLVRGEFYRLDFYEIKQEIELDMLLHGRGYLKFYVDEATQSPCIERVHPLDVLFDELEGRDCPPRTMTQVRLVAKAVLKAQYPEYADEIDAATIADERSQIPGRTVNQNEMCEVIEGWRKESSPGAGDGRHMVAVTTCTLCYDPWSEEDFPFATLTWQKMRRGPYAISAAEQIIFAQRNLNRMVQREQECLYFLSAPTINVDESSLIDTAHYESGGVGNFIVRAAGTPEPTISVNKVVPDDIRLSKQEMKQQISEVLGLTGIEQSGQKPAGLDSAPALQEYTEQTSIRHVKTLKENERFVLRAAKLLLITIRQIKETYGDYKAFGEGRSEVEEISFTENDLPPNAFRMQMGAANMLPQTPAGRMSRIVQIANMGVFTPKQVLRMFQSPDIDAAVSDVTSGEEDIDWTIYHLTKPNGEYYPPDEHQDLDLGINKVTAAYLRERRNKAPDAVLERLDRWVSDALLLAQAQMQAAQQQAMAQQAAQAQAGVQTQQANSQSPTGGPSGVPPGEAPAGA